MKTSNQSSLGQRKNKQDEIMPAERETIKEITGKTVFQMDYNHRQEILAVCGNFGDMRLIKGDIESLIKKSHKIKAKEVRDGKCDVRGTR